MNMLVVRELRACMDLWALLAGKMAHLVIVTLKLSSICLNIIWRYSFKSRTSIATQSTCSQVTRLSKLSLSLLLLL
jgi:hypothetical protein